MPKQKTHKGLSKRVTVTGRGKVKWKRSGSSHLNSHMSGGKIRVLRQKRVATAPDIPRLQQMLKRRLTPGGAR